MPFFRSAPSVLRGWAPVRKQAAARAWSPGPSPFASAFSCFRPEITSSRSRTAASGSSVGPSSNPSPSVFGVHDSIHFPFGTKQKAWRSGDAGAERRPRA
jgi:hypothetical protein